jgi:Ni/Fe-hydrogenase subunit HybB-like protein
MNAIPFRLLGAIVIFAAGAPILFITATRLVAYRLAGRATHLPAPPFEPLPLPVIRLGSWSRALVRLAMATLIGVGLGIILLRFVFGLGAVTHLSDAFPWGLWISFDVMSGVALAAGAFVLCATVHIFGLKRFDPLVRPAVLTGLLGYLLVIAGLVVDLGRPYNIWRPLVHWQHHSVLWEVGVCVATYTTVLFIEFLPAILERLVAIAPLARRLPLQAILHLLRRVSIVFVILGIVLSTLHQSSLGSLWVLVPEKLHPLWYTIYLPFFFWLSAVAVGLTMVIVEATLSARAFHRGLEIDLLADLAKAAAVVLALYLVLKLADLVGRGAWPLLFRPSLEATSYWLEIGLGVVIPMALFSQARLRRQPRILFGGALLVVAFGIVLNRLNVGLIGLLAYTGPAYIPSWMEVVVTLTLVSLGVIAFALAARYLPVFTHEE